MDFQANQVVTLKLTSGEEVIAKVLSYDKVNNMVELQEPVSIAPGPQGIGLVPSMFTADTKQSVKLNVANITFFAFTDDNVKLKYLEATTGIKVPEKKLILG
jgi:small nuclear ribonucleoprotein (snRNP)-like protein